MSMTTGRLLWAPQQTPTKATRSISSPTPPKRILVDVAYALAGLGLGATIGLAFVDETHSEFVAPGGMATFFGGLTGLIGTYLALIMVLLVSRLPFIERALGQDGLVRAHRWLSPWPLSLIGAHAVLITVGYAQAARTGAWHELGTLIADFPNVLAATVALGLMVMIGVVSIRAIRSRLRRETWWAIHLYMYLALALSFAHVILLGPSFVGHPLTQAVWSIAWAATAGVVLVFRFGLPVFRSLRHDLRVVEVRPEAPGVVSIICKGKHLEQLPVSGGQFFCWRFLARGMWWQAHPYSLSALPHPPYMRITVKDLGDHSKSLAALQRGTRVFIEGPYGAFTRHAQRRRRAVLLAGGIGVTALRALLEDLPNSARPIVIVRASNEEDVAFRDEIAQLVEHRHGKFHELTGPRDKVRIDEKVLDRLVPDLSQRDVYVCGPAGFVHHMTDLVRHLGVPTEAVHHEAFAL